MDPKGLDSDDPDPPGDKKPKHKKPGVLKKLWRIVSGENHILRAEYYCFELSQCAANVQTIDTDKDTRVVIARFDYVDVSADECGDPVVTITSTYKYSIFREVRPQNYLIHTSDSDDDDRNLNEEQFINKFSSSLMTIQFDPGVGGAAKGGVVLAGRAASKIFIVTQGVKLLQNWRKAIRMGVNDADILVKGFHVHLEGGLELGLKTLKDGKIGVHLVGKKTFTALQVENAVSIFNNAMRSAEFRKELLVRLVATQEYLQHAFKGIKTSQLAIDKAHELNYIIQSLRKMK